MAAPPCRAGRATCRQPGRGRRPAADDAGRDRRFQRRRGRGQDRGAALEPGARQRHVAGVVVDGLLLLEAGIVLLVDDDQAEARSSGRNRAERAPTTTSIAPSAISRQVRRRCARGQRRVPHRRRRAEPTLEPAQPLGRERDLGQQDEHAAAGAQGRRPPPRNRPRSCRRPARRRAAPRRRRRGDQAAQLGGGRLPAAGSARRPGGPGSGRGQDGRSVSGHGCQQAVARHGLHHAGADAGGLGQRRGRQAVPSGERREDGGTLAARPRAAAAVAPGDRRAWSGQGSSAAGTLSASFRTDPRGASVSRATWVTSCAERRRHRRRVEHRAERLEPVARYRPLQVARPRPPRSARGRRTARRRRSRRGGGCPVLQQIVERPVERDGHQDGHDGAERARWAAEGGR